MDKTNKAPKMAKKETRGTTAAQDKNIITLIKKSAPLFWVDHGYYPHYSHKLGKLSAGFTVEKLANGKPATIEQVADPNACNYLFIFISKETRESEEARARGLYFSWNSRAALYLVKWENNRAKPCDWTDRSCRKLLGFCSRCWNCQDAENLRKIGDAFYLLKVAPQYNDQDQKKQEQRRNNQPNLTTSQRLKGAQPCQNEEERKHGARYETKENGTRWGLTYSRRCLDASGYDLTTTRAALYQRVQELKKAQKLEQWNNTDHSETVQELRTYAEELKRAAVDMFLSSADFYTQDMAQDFRKCADYIEKTADQIENKTAENAENIAHRVEHSRELVKKCQILRPLAADPRAYGWTWWELNESGELVNTYKENKLNRKYYDRITADSVGIIEEQPREGATL